MANLLEVSQDGTKPGLITQGLESDNLKEFKNFQVEIEKTCFISIKGDDAVFSKLVAQPFLKIEKEINSTVILSYPSEDIPRLEESVKFGAQVFARTLALNCYKLVTNPGNLFKVIDDRVELPSNLEASSDGLIYKMISIYATMGIKVDKSQMTLGLPNKFSEGWIRQFSAITDLLAKLSKELKKVEPEKLSVHCKIPALQSAIDVMVFKFACRKNLVTYLTDGKKLSGNLSEQAFKDISLAWGTPITGNICQRALSGIYDLLGIMSKHESFEKVVQKGFFLSAVQLKKSFEPTRIIVLGKGKNKKVEKKGDINVLRLDNIRFLIPSERAELRSSNVSQELDDAVKAFDKLEISERDYDKLVNKLKAVIAHFSNYYFQIRRNARNRLYVIKEVRKEANQPDQINDSEFNRNDMIDTTKSLIEAYIIDKDRKEGISVSLSTPVLIPTLTFGEI